MVNTWIFFHSCKQEQWEKQTSFTSYAAISLSPHTSLYGEGRSCKMEAMMTCLYCLNMLPMVTVSEEVTNITHCYNPFTTVSSPHSSLHSQYICYKSPIESIIILNGCTLCDCLIS